MKKVLSLLTASALVLTLTACGDFAPDPTEAPEKAMDYEYTESNYPNVYASAAYTPLTEAVTAIMLGTTRERAARHVETGLSSDAVAAVQSGDAGVALVPAGVTIPAGIDSAPVARDALVFFVGRDSKIDSLTTDELARIFSGRADDWSDFGGSGEIRLLTHPEGSGSLAALEELLDVDASAAVGESDPLTGSDTLGFGLWSECSVMGLADGYKLIAVDGVEPSADTIKSGEYTLGLDTLVLVDHNAAEDSGERALWLWMQGSVGQAFISSQGYLEAGR